MYYIFFLIAAALFFACLALLYPRLNCKHPALKKIIPVIIFMAVFVVRYFCSPKNYLLNNFIGLNSTPFSPAVTVLALIASWFSIAAFVLCVLQPFFNLPTAKALAKYFLPISAILNIVLLNTTAEMFCLGSPQASFTVYKTLLSVECGLSLGYGAYLIFKDIKAGEYKNYHFDYKFVLTTIGVLGLMLLATLPLYAPQLLLGKVQATLVLKDLSPHHRMLLYAAFIIPALLYFWLKNKSAEVIRYSLLFISLATMISYCVGYSYETMTDLSAWPFHLCNTAMFIVPICLIFKFDKLFYFTYFINVLGAFLAMAMPNTSDGADLFSYGITKFWLNHWCAFFMPLLIVALKEFKRPNLKSFSFSMIWFAVYFILVLVLNVYFGAHGKTVDYFFINSDFIADKLGVWAEKLYDLSADITINGFVYTFHPLYQFLFFLVYILLGLGMWFIYELLFNIAISHLDLNRRKKKIRLDQYALKASLNGRSLEEPMNIEAGTKLELKEFSKRYANNKNYAVYKADLEVVGGEIFGFLGPNGAGKSTIIKSIVGIQPITEGKIEVCGFDCAVQPVMAKRQIGYVPDHYALYERLTGREYINYIADIFDVSLKDRNERIKKYTDLFELNDAIDSPIRTYSHGMKQKITIMSALVHNPKIWILDEPLTGLDPNSIFQVKECMRTHAEEGNIVFFSSHIIEVVEKLCHRITIIKNGQIQCTKSIAEIEKECSLEEFYLKTINSENAVEPITVCTAEKA